jgi:hypothetical protein
LAIVALKRSWRQLFRWKTGRRAENSKWPAFEVTTAAHDSRAVGTAQHQSHRTIDPQCLKKSPPRRGGIYALTKNVALHFTLNQDKTLRFRLYRNVSPIDQSSLPELSTSRCRACQAFLFSSSGVSPVGFNENANTLRWHGFRKQVSLD